MPPAEQETRHERDWLSRPDSHDATRIAIGHGGQPPQDPVDAVEVPRRGVAVKQVGREAGYGAAVIVGRGQVKRRHRASFEYSQPGRGQIEVTRAQEAVIPSTLLKLCRGAPNLNVHSVF